MNILRRFKARIQPTWAKVRTWIGRFWTDIRPGPEANRGVQWAVFATAALAAIAGGLSLHSGFGLIADLAFAFAVATLGIPLVALILFLLFKLLRALPPWRAGFLAGACAFIGLLWPPPLGILVGVMAWILEGTLGATIATFVGGNFAGATGRKKIVTIALFVLAVAGNVGLVWFLSNEGTEEGILRLTETATPQPAQLKVANPAEPGSIAVHTLMYGSGNDKRRPEFGKSVALKTATVDASAFFKDFTGWKANLRKFYWGFEMDKLPLNARVWYPEGPGPFPLVLIVHGNHEMAEFSDPGYQYLGELLASRGFILASIDENFLNSGLFHDPPKQQVVRGWMLLEHLKLWRDWNQTKGNPFYQRVDMNNIALMGHSRGGEAAATAALFNRLSYYPDDATIRFQYGFPIKAIVAIAPVDGQYKPVGEFRTIENVDYLTLQGANDSDVSSFMGSRQWDHVRFTDNGPWFKSELYIYGANHGQFNTVWGRSDAGDGPLSWLLNLKPLMNPEDQRRIARTYISAFVETALHGQRDYLPMFQDYRAARAWLPRTYYMSRYLDASDQVIDDFHEDADVTTTTLPGGHLQGENLSVWREGRIPWRKGDRGSNGVFLGWNRKQAKPPLPSYSMALPSSLPISPTSVLTLSIAVTEDKAPLPGQKPDDKDKEEKSKDDKAKDKPETTDLTLELLTNDGKSSSQPLSNFGTLLPPFKVRLTKLEKIDDFAYEKASEPVFQTIRVPLGAFGIETAKLKTIRLRFDKTESRVIILNYVGITK